MESHDLRSMNRITITALGVVAFVGLMASSGGVAEQQNQDRTGAPGSNSPCSACHNAAGTNASASWQIVDPLTNQEVTTYLAGQDYLVRMVVESTNANRYGAQGTVVFSDGSNAGTFSSPAGNVQLEDVNGRHIIEQNSLSNSNVFEVTWTAPAAGSGDAKFYMSGLACDGDGGTVGDAYDGASFTLPEEGTSSLADLSLSGTRPVAQFGQWTWTAPTEGQFVVADLAGRVLSNDKAVKGQRVEWEAQGVHVASFVSNDGRRASWTLGAH